MDTGIGAHSEHSNKKGDEQFEIADRRTVSRDIWKNKNRELTTCDEWLYLFKGLSMLDKIKLNIISNRKLCENENLEKQIEKIFSAYERKNNFKKILTLLHSL